VLIGAVPASLRCTTQADALEECAIAARLKVQQNADGDQAEDRRVSSGVSNGRRGGGATHIATTSKPMPHDLIRCRSRPRSSTKLRSRSAQRLGAAESEVERAARDVAVALKPVDEGSKVTKVKFEVVALIFVVIRSNGSSMLQYGRAGRVSEHIGGATNRTAALAAQTV
jgi:hypothetical protein